MSKINRIDKLRIALKSGFFWKAFDRKMPVETNDFIEDNPTANFQNVQQKSKELWDKYTELKRKYLDGEIWVGPYSEKYQRLMALYHAHQRDLQRLFQKSLNP